MWEKWMEENSPLNPDFTDYKKQTLFANTFSNVMAREYGESIDIIVEDEDFLIDECLHVSGCDDDRTRDIVHAMWKELNCYFPVDSNVTFIEETPTEFREYRESDYDDFASENVEHIQPSN
jgi:hypothetical protein